ncbi:MAG TPA: succinate dehydrogenase cytochrome b subunit [Thermoanaerobaculia bacterium]|nr:succinate dehydrogenase cytochrome b subunit [Thermoanaerobaculia bacterium]
MEAPRGFARSSIGRKVIMAATGVILVGFVVVHMLGNLQVYMGPEAMNRYAVFLREFLHGGGLWIARAVLLAAVVLHIWSATSLTLTSRRARPVGYREQQWKESTYASRTMRWGGVILLLFVIYHILHLTTGTVHQSFIEGDVYHNFVAGFRVVPVSLFYIFAMLALGLHLRHGVWSMFQTLGVSHPRYIHAARVLAWIVAIVVVVGNISFPLAVLAGLVK